jgi:hypothetical protein
LLRFARNDDYLYWKAYKSHNSGYTYGPNSRDFGMRLVNFGPPVALALMALALSACSHRGEAPASYGLTEDDDTFCRKGGQVAPGSPEYVNCRKDRDTQRGNAVTRADKKQRDLGEYMLNNPSRP